MSNATQTDAVKRKTSSMDHSSGHGSEESDPHVSPNEPHPRKRFHPQLLDDKSGSETLPNVHDLISPITLNMYCNGPLEEVGSDMLHTFFTSVYDNKMWSTVLDEKYNTKKNCREALKYNKELADLFGECAKSRDFQKLFDSPFLRVSLPRSDSSQSYGVVDADLSYFKDAFEKTYHSINPRILLDTMDDYKPSRSSSASGFSSSSSLSSSSPPRSEPYNHSFPIIQSSGMGKSRLVDHSATLRFAIPFNLIEATEANEKGYPPADADVGNYLAIVTSQTAIVRYMSFLEALFAKVVAELVDFIPSTREQVAQQWYNKMKEGATFDSTGTYRTQLYEQVVEEARKLEIGGNTISQRQNSLRTAASTLVTTLHKLYRETVSPSQSKQFHAFVYFDEAHRLQSTSGDNYFHLMRAIKVIDNTSIFFVFLSTSSSLQLFAPTKADYPSLRVRTGGDLHQPFFELPFDSFSHRFSSEAKAADKLTFKGVCELGQMSKFGRPMWYSHYISIPKTVDDGTHPTMKLAKLKLKEYVFKRGDEKSHKLAKARLAALGCRILLPFDHFSINSRNMQSSLVESYMRCVFYIPPTREYVWSGYPSEPILSQAAGQLLNDSPGKIINLAPEIIADAFRNNLLDRGERGELVAQLLLTIAHDHVILENNKETPPIDQPFHSPIYLLELLEKLFSADVWSLVCDAKPFEAHPGDPSLKDAFANARVSFSHFVQLGDHKSLNIETVCAIFERGGGIKPYAKQPYVDLVIGVVFATETEEITKDKFSVVQIQVKNRDMPDQVHMESPLIKEIFDHPVLSIVMELGVEKNKTRVDIQSTQKSLHTRATDTSTLADLRRRHYVITAYGCTSKTYQCIPEDSKVYRTLLAAEKPFQEFPRSKNHKMMHEMKSLMFNSNTLSNLSWHN